MRACHLIYLPASQYVCVFVCVRACVCVCMCNMYSVRVYERGCALIHANVCVCVHALACLCFFVFVHMNSDRECLYTCMLVQNVYVCR